jgi:hypothetical protein
MQLQRLLDSKIMMQLKFQDPVSSHVLVRSSAADKPQSFGAAGAIACAASYASYIEQLM